MENGKGILPVIGGIVALLGAIGRAVARLLGRCGKPDSEHDDEKQQEQ